MQLDRRQLFLLAQAQAKMKAERAREVAALSAWFVDEMVALRRELAQLKVPFWFGRECEHFPLFGLAHRHVAMVGAQDPRGQAGEGRGWHDIGRSPHAARKGKSRRYATIHEPAFDAEKQVVARVVVVGGKTRSQKPDPGHGDRAF